MGFFYILAFFVFLRYFFIVFETGNNEKENVHVSLNVYLFQLALLMQSYDYMSNSFFEQGKLIFDILFS